MNRVCRIMIRDRSYSDWHFIDSETYDSIDIATQRPELSMVTPSYHKLFTQDSITVIPDDTTGGIQLQIVHSAIRTTQMIAGVLILEKNKTFGRSANKKRLLYKCLPDDKHLPAFMVPYEVKLGFTKSLVNKYVVFRFDHWNEKHPHGILVETLGDVDNLDVFYEYQIYCRNLHASLTEFNDKTKHSLRAKTQTEYVRDIANDGRFRILDKTNDIHAFSPIFTIDPCGCTDFDDAFSIQLPSNHQENPRISVYIANVFVWLETLGLWNAFSQRVATIYLPDRRRPMLPTILSDTLCSLRETSSTNHTSHEEPTRFAFVMTVELDRFSGMILPETAVFRNERIRITHNYVYESPELMDDTYYRALADATQRADPSVGDSHEVVSYWMIQMNRICGEKMAKSNTGIFRKMVYLNAEDKTRDVAELNDDTRRMIQTWNNTSGQYIVFSKENVHQQAEHDVMKLKNYIHITSPIRRLVDLLNQMMFMREFGMMESFSVEGQLFLQSWIDRIDYINLTMRSIRKVQTDCEVLRHCMQTPGILQQVHMGVVFDKMRRNDGTYSYMVYLEHIRVLSRVNCLYDWENYARHDFKLFVFEEEDNVKHKIRLFPTG